MLRVTATAEVRAAAGSLTWGKGNACYVARVVFPSRSFTALKRGVNEIGTLMLGMRNSGG
jgi:hypothetical protein